MEREVEEQVDEAVDDWTSRAEHGGDATGHERAAEEHSRYEEATGGAPRADGDAPPGADGEERRHDTPPGAEQSAG